MFLSPGKTWAQPSYYVTQMIARANFPQLVAVDCQSPAGALDATARLSADRKQLALQVVNSGEQSLQARLEFAGFKPRGAAKVNELAGPLDARNTAADPERIVPRERTWNLPAAGEALEYEFPAHSFTVLMFE